MTSREDATVLVVDDEPDVTDAYAAQLDDQYEIETAYNGEEAIEALGPDIDIVLLDRRMPDISGDEVLTEIKERELGARVAMVTAVDPDFDIIDMPFDDYVVKPVSRRDLVETIERLLLCSEYETRIREYYSLTSKYATLKASKTEAELASSDEFEQLEAEIDELREELDDLVSSFDDEGFSVMFREFDTHEPSTAE